MLKFKLNPEELEVDSFTVPQPSAGDDTANMMVGVALAAESEMTMCLPNCISCLPECSAGCWA